MNGGSVLLDANPEILNVNVATRAPVQGDPGKIDSLAAFQNAIKGCQVECKCIFDHDSADMWHRSGSKMSNILPGVCRDHTTSIFGLDEKQETVKHIDYKTCTTTNVKIQRIVARGLSKEYYAFNANDWILPQLAPVEMLMLYTNNITTSIFNDISHLSFQVRNFIKHLQEAKLRVVDICKPVGSTGVPGNGCDKKAFVNACALYALLTSGYLDVSDNLGDSYDELAAHMLGEVAAIQIFLNHKTIRKCLDQMQIQPLGLTIPPNDRKKVVMYNFLSRCELKYEDSKASYKPNATIQTSGIMASTNICDHEQLRVELPAGFDANVIERLKNRLTVLMNSLQTPNIVKPPLSEQGQVNSATGFKPPTFNHDSVRDVLNSCRVSIGIY